jgi:outer membrane protein insertion porin family
MLCLWSLHPDAGLAQGMIGAPITEVVVEQEGRPVSDPFVLGLVETTVGEPLSMADVRETTAHLMSLDRYEDVESLAEPTAGGVRVVYRLRPLHPIDRITVRAAAGIGTGELRRLIEDRFGRSPSAGRVADVADLVRDALRRRGYAAARVAAFVEETHAPDRATLIVEIAAGRRAAIAEVQFIQVDSDVQGPVPFVPDIRRGTPYDEQDVERELQAWVRRMHERGYYGARATHGVSFPPDGDAFLRVNLARGPHVTVVFAGDPLPDDERERLVPIRAEGAIDEDLLEDATIAIENYLHSRGYRDADAVFTREERGGELTITFDVRRGPRHVVNSVRISGNRAFTAQQLRELLRIKEGDIFVRAALDAGVNAIVAAYHARGYPGMTAHVSDAALPPERPGSPDRGVEIAIAITEGPRTIVRKVAFEGHEALPDGALRALVATAPGRPYVEAEVARDRDVLELEYRNRGYGSATVRTAIAFADDGTQADVRFTIVEGPQVLVDHIIIVGNRRTDAEVIERALVLRPGEPLGFNAMVESRARLRAIGLFRSVRVEPIGPAGRTRRDVLVAVEEADATTFDFGGGVEAGFRARPGEARQAEDQFEVVPRGFFQIGRRNLWGRNRSVDLFTRVSLRARDIAAVRGAEAATSEVGFNEYRVAATWREPAAFGTAADVMLSGRFEQAIRSSFDFNRRDVRAEIGRQFTPRYSGVGRVSFERTRIFNRDPDSEQAPLIDRLFPQVRLVRVSGTAIRDTRDDPLDPTRGSLATMSIDLAARAIGSEVGFVRTYVEGFLYRRLPVRRSAVLALGARLGAADGFPREKDGRIVQDLPASERFFAGGDTSVRGFSLDRAGDERTITPAGFPTGGNGVIVFNAELRVHALGPVRQRGEIQVVGFVDAGNVFPRVSGLDVTDLRPAAGFGVRYRSPVGPIRVDLGFNLDRRELVPGVRERGTVLHISLGQAF